MVSRRFKVLFALDWLAVPLLIWATVSTDGIVSFLLLVVTLICAIPIIMFLAIFINFYRLQAQVKRMAHNTLGEVKLGTDRQREMAEKSYVQMLATGVFWLGVWSFLFTSCPWLSAPLLALNFWHLFYLRNHEERWKNNFIRRNYMSNSP